MSSVASWCIFFLFYLIPFGVIIAALGGVVRRKTEGKANQEQIVTWSMFGFSVVIVLITVLVVQCVI